MSSSDALDVMRPGGRLVVDGAGLETAVQGCPPTGSPADATRGYGPRRGRVAGRNRPARQASSSALERGADLRRGQAGGLGRSGG